MLVNKIANRKNPDQTASSEAVRLLLQKQSDLGLHCLSKAFLRATSVRNFRVLKKK